MGHSQWPVCQATSWQEGIWTIIEHIVYTLPTCFSQSAVNSVVFHPNGKQVLTTGKGAIVISCAVLCRDIHNHCGNHTITTLAKYGYVVHHLYSAVM